MASLGIRTLLRQISVTDSSSSVQNLPSKFQEEYPLISPSIGTVSRSSLYAADAEKFQTKVLKISKEIRGGKSFGALPSS